MSNQKRHELRCQYCGRKMYKSRPDAKYHDKCRVAAWRERKYEAQHAAVMTPVAETRTERILREMDGGLDSLDRYTPEPEPSETEPSTKPLHMTATDALGKYMRVAIVRGVRVHVAPQLDADGYWAPAVDGKRLYWTCNERREVISLGCPTDPEAARLFMK